MTDKEKEAYAVLRAKLKEQRIADSQFSSELFKEWDVARRKLNPNAKLSIAEEILAGIRPEQEE